MGEPCNLAAVSQHGEVEHAQQSIFTCGHVGRSMDDKFRSEERREEACTDLAFMLCVFYAEPRISRIAISSGRSRAISCSLVHSLKAKSVHFVKWQRCRVRSSPRRRRSLGPLPSCLRLVNLDSTIFLQLTYFAVEAAPPDLFDMLGGGEEGRSGGEGAGGRGLGPSYILASLAFPLVFAPR